MSRKRFEATAEQRQQVEMYAAIGLTQVQIGQLLGVSVDTLDRHFRSELDLGAVKANAKVAGKLFNNAMGGDNASIFFWLKTRGGWRETDRREHTGKDGAPLLPPSVIVPADVVRELLRSRDDAV